VSIPFTAELVEATAGVFFSPMYDNPQPTPNFHREGWELYCSDVQKATIVAPREHAKSTAFTHNYLLTALLFRVEMFAIVVSATEDLAKDHLADIAKVLRENDEVIQEFGIIGMPIDAKTEIVVKFSDGYEFRVLAKGSGQKMRGLKWKGRRPGLIVGDDLEEDEQVESRDRRVKFRRWVFRALLPCLRRGGKIRLHGTILHEDSLLARLQKDSEWGKLFFKAHEGFDDFTNILWPEQFPEARLRSIRQGYINQGDAPGYSQEYLNDPLDNSDAYLMRDWFIPMQEFDRHKRKIVCAAADFAISKADKANRTSLTIGGKCDENLLHFIDQRVGRWDALQICDEMFALQANHHPDIFWVEDGQIWKALKPTLEKEMLRRNKWINIVARLSIKDKASRGRALQMRMRSGGTRWDTEAEWFPSMQDEMLRFTGYSEATLDDQFDSAALLALGFEALAEVESDDLLEEDELDMLINDPRNTSGRNAVTGY